MSAPRSHIISGLRWNTLFDDKKRAPELQERLSTWSRYHLPKQAAKVLDQFCADGQTWSIPLLELDLGMIDLHSLESDLTERLGKQLKEKLTDLLIHAGDGNNSAGIRLISETVSGLEALKNFLLQGRMPWNYESGHSSASQLLQQLLQSDLEGVILVIRETGQYEPVRRRIAWQMDEPSVKRIIEGLEPDHHQQIIRFSEELAQVRRKKEIVPGSAADFKKNIWHWIMNYLLTERGTLFNKVAFVKSNIRQMSAHYNIRYEELLALIEQAVDLVDKKAGSNNSLVAVLKLVTQQDHSSHKENIKQTEAQHWLRLQNYLTNQATRQRPLTPAEASELIVSFAERDSFKFRRLALHAARISGGFSEPAVELRQAAREKLLQALNPSQAAALIESIHFISALRNEATASLSEKLIWRVAFRFLQQPAHPTFKAEAFVKQLITEVQHETKINTQQLLASLAFARVSPPAGTGVALQLHKALVAAYAAGFISTAPVAALKYHFGKLIEIIDKAGSGAGVSDLFLIHQSALAACVRLDPKQALMFFSSSSNRNILLRVMPEPLDGAMCSLLLEQLEKEFASVLLIFSKALNTATGNELSQSFINQYGKQLQGYSLFCVFCLRAPKLPGRLLHRFSDVLSATQYKQLSRIVLLETGLYTETPDQKHSQIISIPSLLQMLNNGLPACELARVLKIHFMHPGFVALHEDKPEQAARFLDHLIAGGNAVMKQLLEHYTIALMHAEGVNAPQLRAQLSRLYWTCILDYNSHCGNVTAFIRHFRSAILLYIPAAKKSKQLLRTKTSGKHVFVAGKRITTEQLIAFINSCLDHERTSFDEKDRRYSLHELFSVALQAAPDELRQLIKKTTGDKKMTLLQGAVSFESCCLWFSTGGTSRLGKDLEMLRTLYAISRSVAQDHNLEKLDALYWKQLWALVKHNGWPAAKREGSIKELFYQLGIITGASTPQLEEEIEREIAALPPLIQQLLIECLNSFSIRSQARVLPMRRLLQADKKGVLDNLVHSLLQHQQLPAWFGKPGDKAAKKVLAEITLHYPFKLIVALKNMIHSEQKLRWLHSAVSFNQFATTIGYAERSRRTELSQLVQLHSALDHWSGAGISSAEIRFLLFSKLITAWSRNTWQLLSAEQIIEGLAWEAGIRKGSWRKQFLLAMQKLKHLLPFSLQAVPDQLLKKEMPVARLVKPVAQQKPRASVSSQPYFPIVEKEGVRIKNAGLVLLNSYMPMLFERLGLVSNRQFVDERMQIDAVHYLQYVVTGLVMTPEELLPLNKLLCGIPLLQPVHEGIVLAGSQELLINGLISAAISHWPAIGNCSVEGFRGNWLVRDGMLVEQEERWELTVEKRPYDLLIHQSPFSFSIIRYPWMEKPLHVYWSY